MLYFSANTIVFSLCLTLMIGDFCHDFVSAIDNIVNILTYWIRYWSSGKTIYSDIGMVEHNIIKIP